MPCAKFRNRRVYPVDCQNHGNQSTSSKSFEDAVQQGIARATKTLRNVRSAWVKEQQVRVENGCWEHMKMGWNDWAANLAG
jgi:hypothetical protein